MIKTLLCIGGPLDGKLHIYDGSFVYFTTPLRASQVTGTGRPMPYQPIAIASNIQYDVMSLCGEMIWVAQKFPREMIIPALLRRLRMRAEVEDAHNMIDDPRKFAVLGLTIHQIYKLINHYEMTEGPVTSL